MEEQKRTVRSFAESFGRLQVNRKRVPVQQLETKFAKPYKKLVDEVSELAEWYTLNYIKICADAFKCDAGGSPDAATLDAKIEAILQEERRAGGIFERQRAALVDDLDFDAYWSLLESLEARVTGEVLLPFWHKHCHWIGPEDNRWIYNDITGLYWCAPGRVAEWPAGMWVTHEWEPHGNAYPPDEALVKINMEA